MTALSKMTTELEFWLQSYPEGKAWFNTLKSEQTKRSWIGRFFNYCQAVNKSPTELIDLKLDGTKNTGTAKEWQAEQLFVNYLNDNLTSDNVRCSVKSAVRAFYHANWRDLNRNAGENISQPEPKQRTPKMEDLIDLCDNMTFKRDKFLIWFLDSCPFRVGTVSKLLWKDLLMATETKLTFLEYCTLKEKEKENMKVTSIVNKTKIIFTGFKRLPLLLFTVFLELNTYGAIKGSNEW